MMKKTYTLILILFSFSTLQTLYAQSKKELQVELRLVQEMLDLVLRENGVLYEDSTTTVQKIDKLKTALKVQTNQQNEKIENLEEEVEELQNENQQLKQKKDNAENSIDEMLQRYNKLEDSYNQLEKNSTQESAYISTLQDKLDSVLVVNAQMDAEIEDLESFLDEKDEDIMFLQEKLVKVREEYGVELEDD